MTPETGSTWAIVVGEYPPQLGGVSDYTWQIAEALAREGDDVHVFAPRWPSELSAQHGVTLHRLPDRYGLRGLLWTSRELARLPKSRRVLVQFVVQSFGAKAMNVAFALWLASTRPDVMFHETAIEVDPSMRATRKIQAIVTQLIAFIVMRVARRVFVSTPAWIPRIRAWAPHAKPIHLFIPSNVPTAVDERAVAIRREEFRLAGAGPVVGHFGTYKMSETKRFLDAFVPLFLARHPSGSIALAGRGGVAFARALSERLPNFAARITACVGEDAADVATYLAACDMLVQPYYDGATTRRTSLSAGLALGKPIVSNTGRATEELWRTSGAIALAKSFDAASFLEEVTRLADHREARETLGELAATLYRERFSIAHTVQALRAGMPADSQRVKESS